jgi:hypothetical protein
VTQCGADYQGAFGIGIQRQLRRATKSSSDVSPPAPLLPSQLYYHPFTAPAMPTRSPEPELSSEPLVMAPTPMQRSQSDSATATYDTTRVSRRTSLQTRDVSMAVPSSRSSIDRGRAWPVGRARLSSGRAPSPFSKQSRKGSIARSDSNNSNSSLSSLTESFSRVLANGRPTIRSYSAEVEVNSTVHVTAKPAPAVRRTAPKKDRPAVSRGVARACAWCVRIV